MKTSNRLFGALAAVASTLLFVSCQKNNADTVTSAADDTGSAFIAVAATTRITTGTSTDSVYLLQSCRRGERRDSISQSALPADISTYLAATYSGAVFSKAFSLTSTAGSLGGYVVVVYYNNNPVGLLFNASGAFVRVLEQREPGDLQGAGWHHGGRFEHRDGLGRDSIALSALPGGITAYLSANYPGDTLLRAFRAHDSSIVVLSQNNGLFATVFDATGVFVNRIPLPARNGQHSAVALSALPGTAASYLGQTYPGYVFEKAFSVSDSSGVREYVVIIDANNSKYAVVFDAAGNFLRARTIH
ncbi:PepSY-like domain-containing protein [Flaviaesturariibacter terrae]